MPAEGPYLVKLFRCYSDSDPLIRCRDIVTVLGCTEEIDHEHGRVTITGWVMASSWYRRTSLPKRPRSGSRSARMCCGRKIAQRLRLRTEPEQGRFGGRLPRSDSPAYQPQGIYRCWNLPLLLSVHLDSVFTLILRTPVAATIGSEELSPVA
jgi:hypothetical protein